MGGVKRTIIAQGRRGTKKVKKSCFKGIFDLRIILAESFITFSEVAAYNIYPVSIVGKTTVFELFAIT